MTGRVGETADRTLREHPRDRGCGGPVEGAVGIPCGTATGEFVHRCHGCRIATLEGA